MKNCPICQSNNTKIVFNESGIDIIKCKNCSHLFSSFEGEENYDKYFGYEEIKDGDYYYWDRARDMMYEDFSERFLKNKKGILLDYGCGMGFFIKKIKDIKNWEIKGLEISRQAVNYANIKLNLNNIFCGNINEYNFNDIKFDIITLWDVIEHIKNPDKTINKISKILSNDGILFIHTPNAKLQLFKARLKKILFGMKSNIHYFEPKDHLNIYTSNSISILLKRNGFKKIKFIHLKPIKSMSGNRSSLAILFKYAWYYASVFLFYLTFGIINIDNLFVVAIKDN